MLTFRGKQFFLTYPQCDVGLELLLEHLKTKFRLLEKEVSQYTIGHELHEDGNPHRHCYIVLDSEFRGQVSARHFDFGDYHGKYEVVKKPTKCLNYCRKDGNFISNMSQVSKPTKELVGKLLIEGTPLSKIVEKYPQYLFGYKRTREDLQAYQADKRERSHRDRPVGIWISGPSGCGKSTIAQTRMGSVYIKDNSKWWDGYNGEEGCVCEDVDKSWRDILPKFKVWADRYEFPGEIKGGQIKLNLQKFIVTSNQTLSEFLDTLNWSYDDREPYLRRFREYRIRSIQDWEEQL